MHEHAQPNKNAAKPLRKQEEVGIGGVGIIGGCWTVKTAEIHNQGSF